MPANKFYGVLLLAFFLPVPELSWSSSSDFRVEGIIEDAENPAHTLAVINGMPFMTGDTIEGYKVAEIKTGSVRLVHEKSGEVISLVVSAGAPKFPTTPSTDSGASPSVESAPPSFFQKMQHSFQDALKAPGGAMNRMWELMALRDLAIINNAAVQYYEKNKFFPRDIRQLTLDGFLAKSYENGTNSKYKFYFTNTTNPNDLGLHADPLAAASGLRHFYVGPDAVIRESTGQPATKTSPLHDYPGRAK